MRNSHIHSRQENGLRCDRCAGMTVPELISDGGTRAFALRCIHCGDVTDRLIVRNRMRRKAPLPRRPRTPTYGSDRWKKKKVLAS